VVGRILADPEILDRVKDGDPIEIVLA